MAQNGHLAGASDRDLVIAFQAGDRAAYDELYKRHMPRVRGVCRRMLDNPQDAEEAAQETFLRSFQALSRFNGQYQVGAWLARIAANVCFDQLRSRQRHIRVVDLEDGVEEIEDGSAPDSRIPDRMELTSTLRRIQPLHARALVLRTLKGLSHNEIAGELEMTPNQVKALLHRARISFRRAWQDASGWALAPLAVMRSMLTQRPREAAAAGDGAAAGMMSPAAQVMFEKVAASAMAAVLALAGTPAGTQGTTTERATPPAHSVAERAGSAPVSTGAAVTKTAPESDAAPVDEGAGSRLEDALAGAPRVIEQAIESDREPEDDPDEREGDDGPTTGPTITSKPATDAAKEAGERVKEATDNLP